MSKHAPFVIFVVLAAAFFAVPGVAAADEQPMTVTCSQVFMSLPALSLVT